MGFFVVAVRLYGPEAYSTEQGPNYPGARYDVKEKVESTAIGFQSDDPPLYYQVL